MPFDFTVEYIKGNEIPHVDTLTRLSFRNETNPDAQPSGGYEAFNYVNFEKALLNPVDVRREIVLNLFLQKIIQRIKSGNCKNCTQPFKKNADKLTFDDNMIFNGTCLYVAPRLRDKVVSISHDENHSGIQSTI